jgi:hypothetical protein
MIIEIKGFEKLPINKQYMIRNKLHNIAMEFLKDEIRLNEILKSDNTNKKIQKKIKKEKAELFKKPDYAMNTQGILSIKNMMKKLNH